MMSSSLGDFGTRCERVKSRRLFALAARRKSFITDPRATVSVRTSVNPAIRSPLLSLRPSRRGDGRRRVTSSTSRKKCDGSRLCFSLGGRRNDLIYWPSFDQPRSQTHMHGRTPLLERPPVAGTGLVDISGLKSHSFSLDSDSGSWRHEPES